MGIQVMGVQQYKALVDDFSVLQNLGHLFLAIIISQL